MYEGAGGQPPRENCEETKALEEQRSDFLHAETKRQLDRIEAKLDRYHIVLFGDIAEPEKGHSWQIKELTRQVAEIKAEKSGIRKWVATASHTLIGATAALWLSKVFGIKPP